MSPFDQNIDNDAGHTIDNDDLIAFHLHELSPQQERALHRVLRDNPALQSESIAIAATLRAFPKHEASLPLDTPTLNRHWLALRRSLPVYVPLATASHSLFPRWAFAALAGSALAATALILSRHHNPHSTASPIATIAPPFSTIPIPSPSIPTSSLANAASSSSSTPITSNPHPLLVNHPWSQAPRVSAPSPSVQVQPTPTQPIPHPVNAPPPAEAFPANTSIATNQPPSLPSTTLPPPSPTLTGRPGPSSRTHHEYATDLTLAVIGNITPARSFTATEGTEPSAVIASLTQATTPAIGVLVSFHQQLRPWLGYRVTAAQSEPTFEYTYSLASSSSTGNIIDEHAYELSGTYVVQGPRHRRFTTAAEAGAGLLAFLPANPNLSTVPVGNAFRPAAILGASAEFALTKHLALHAGYRALLYKGPAAALTYGSIVPTTPGNITLSSEPVVGITYRFHPASE